MEKYVQWAKRQTSWGYNAVNIPSAVGLVSVSGGSRNFEGAEDNVSAPSSFIANARHELQGGPKKLATTKLSKNCVKSYESLPMRLDFFVQIKK